MNINPIFDHFLIFTENLEIDFKRLHERFNFPIIFPVINYGSFSSGMFACQNSILELVSYENPKFEYSIKNPNICFSGFALKTDIIIEDLKAHLSNEKLNISEVKTQYVKDKDGNDVQISKIIVINNIIKNFQIFFIQYSTNFIDSKFNELSKKAKWNIEKFTINTNSEENNNLNHLFKKIGFTNKKNYEFLDQRNIKFNLDVSDTTFPIINSFFIKSKEERINLNEFFV
ncbi:hypothetical protein [Leptospira kanakyensis]|uniref:hypothetical protein n=1 Tax=Leptospira kanakyensis TaxID=2484968 RepID=UPI00223DBE11|nr:hypothetical protein [Leptospira kanakyensis]MCW7471785.1 hypothetical protein [Leptospira kanakyensis]